MSYEYHTYKNNNLMRIFFLAIIRSLNHHTIVAKISMFSERMLVMGIKRNLSHIGIEFHFKFPLMHIDIECSSS